MIIRDFYLKQIKPFVDKPVIKVLTGLRRSGKSTILKQIISDLIPTAQNVIYINMELMKYSHITNEKVLYQEISDKISTSKEKWYLFIDEIQQIENWEKAVNSFLAEEKCDIYITGSNSNLLSSELATLIAGRFIEINIFPLSYSEYLQFTNEEDHTDSSFNNFIKFGGLPGIHQMDMDEEVRFQYLEGVFDSIILKDIITRNSIRNPAFLEMITKFVFQNIGNIFSAKSIIDFLKKEKRSVGQETVYNYLNFLEKSFSIYKVPRYDLKGKKILEVNEKYFAGDLGLRHSLLGYNSSDISGILENIIFLELKKRNFNIQIGKFMDKEIDFIVSKRDYKAYIQVTYLLSSDKVINREFEVLKEVKDNYPKFVLSMDKLPLGDLDGIKRIYLPDFLLNEHLLK